MTIYAGLDVSDKTTHVCVVDVEGAVVRRDVVATDPDVLSKWLGKYCPNVQRIVLETGPLSTFLYHGLIERDVPVVCICALPSGIRLISKIGIRGGGHEV